MKEIQKERETFCDKVWNLEGYTHIALAKSNYPAEQRFYLCLEIQQIVGEIAEHAIRMRKGYGQKSTLERMDIAVEKLRWKIRESEKRKYISLDRKYKWMKLLDEIGAMIGGWIRAREQK